METDLGQINDQSEGAESGNAGGGRTEDIEKIEGVQSEGLDNADELGQENLPPELQEARSKLLKAFHEKTQALASEKRQLDSRVKDLEVSHNTLAELMNEEWFKKAYTSEKARRTGQVQDEDMSDEVFENLKNDKRAFREYIRKSAETLIEAKVGEGLSQTSKELKKMRQERQFDDVARAHPEFKNLHEAGALDDLLNKGHNYETAYALHKLRNGGKASKSDIEQEAERILAARRAGSVDKGGMPRVNGGQRIVKAKGLMDAMDQAFAARARGETNFRLVKE